MNICALATGMGGAISVIRISGPDAINIVSNICNKPFADANGYTLHYRTLLSDSKIPIDDVLISVFRAPHSYTGEDSVEISCHASRFIINKTLQTLISAGCRQAQPGEFTQRAFLNGKMDLSQAEAVADIIASTNAATHRIAMSQLRGNFSSKLSSLRDHLLHITSLMELELDFSDHEDIEFANRDELISLSNKILIHIKQLADSFRTGEALKSGIPVAIVGKTNVGKSTLLNCLLHEERAIVSDIHGTTRDVIEDTINVRGIDFRFIDTAGLRTTNDTIERIGIERTHKKLKESSIVLWLVDEPLTQETLSSIRAKINNNQSLIIAHNKIDRKHSISTLLETDIPVINISALEGTNIDLLEQALITAANLPEINENDVIVTSARHYDALIKSEKSLKRVIEGLSNSIPNDLLAEDLRETLHHLSEITGGTITSDEVLGNIFKKFCIGK